MRSTNRALVAHDWFMGCLGCLPWLVVGAAILATIAKVWWPR